MKKSILALGTLLATASLLTACGNETDNGGKKVDDKAAKVEKKAAPSLYKVGDSVKVGKVTYKLVSVAKTDERNEFEESKPANVIKVVYHVINGGDDDLSVGMDLTAYGPDNNKLKSYPVNDQTMDAIAAGKEMDVVAAFGTDKLGKFELQFAPIVSMQKAAKFEVEVQ